MVRLGLFFILLFVSLNAKIINFQEEKYIEVIDNSTLKQGTLEFIQNKIILKYKNSNRVLTYAEDILIIQKNDEIQKIDLSSQIALKMVFLLIESIYKNDMEMLESFFTIEKKKDFIRLAPKDDIKSYLKYVEFKKGETLEFITIHMTNGNTTTIRELND